MTQTSSRPLTFASGELQLEGEMHIPASTPAPGVVVCHPHPLYGGDMDNNVVAAACEALANAGYVALRFNFRGAGRSHGAFDNGHGEREDLSSALDYLIEQPEVDGSRVGVAGYSFGAMVASEIAGPALRGLVLISPPVAFSDIRVEWGCPALILAGDEDSVAPVDRLRVVAAHANAELRTYEGADHSWWGYERDLGQALATFFGTHLA